MRTMAPMSELTSAAHSTPAHPWLASPQEFAAFIDTWERGALPKPAWTHAAHVAVGACYAVRFGADAFVHTKAGILRHNEAVGTANTDTSGYHETLTRFWVDVLAAVTAGLDDEWRAACVAVDRFGGVRDYHAQFYGVDVVRSVEARRTWVPPDRGGFPPRSSGGRCAE